MKTGFLVVLGAGVLVLGYLVTQLVNQPEVDEKQRDRGETMSNVSMLDGKQIVTIDAKGGYTPRVSVVKAGVPTVLRFNTQGTFDCSSVVSLPSKNVNQVLPASGETEISLGTLEGNCGMGMYPFELQVAP